MHSQRSFSSTADLPLHQEIGMPSLSPTMSEGNIVRWLKKEGDKVSPGEVLCEVETDKATVEMECMEEGYVVKIIRGDGSQGIQVGELPVERKHQQKPQVHLRLQHWITQTCLILKLERLRAKLNSLQEASGGKRISINDLVIKAAALALRKVPSCNSSWTDNYIRQYHNVNINVAVQTENGFHFHILIGGCSF